MINTEIYIVFRLRSQRWIYTALKLNMSEIRFDVRLDPGAVKEYQDLENSVGEIVNKSIDELQFRADEVGKLMGNKSAQKGSKNWDEEKQQTQTAKKQPKIRRKYT